MDKRPIGIFDSGVGGMTVLAQIKKYLPNEDLIYLGDTKNFPYGDKSKETIIKLSTKCIEFLIRQEVKMIIIACGTATSQSLEKVKKIYRLPIEGIIYPTVQDIKNSIKTEKLCIGVIATEGTIRSNKWQEELRREMKEVEVINKACPLLAPMAEQGWTNNKVAKEAIKEYMKPFQNQKIDKLILGCTHYPIYEQMIRDELGYEVNLINTGMAVAKYLKNLFEEEKNEAMSRDEKIFLTKPSQDFKKIAERVLGEEIEIFPIK